MARKYPLFRILAAFCIPLLAGLAVFYGGKSTENGASLALRGMSSSASGQAWMWLAENNHELVAAVGPDLPPFVYVNRQGQLTGLLHDYLTILEKRLGCHFRVVSYMTPEILDTLLREKRVSLVLDLQRGSGRTEILESKTITTAPLGIYTSADSRRKGAYALQDLSGKRVSMSVHDANYAHVRDYYPEIIIDPVADSLSAVTRLAVGISDFALVNGPSAEHFIKELNFSSLANAGDTGLSMQLVLGVRADLPELAELVFSTLSSINDEQHAGLVARRLPPSWKNMRFYASILPVFGALLVVLLSGMGIFFLWTRSLRRQVRIQSAQLREELSLRRNMEMLLLHSAKVEAVGTLTSGIYHDLNNIMTVIAGYADLNNTAESGADWKKNTAKMAFAANQAKSILERLLSFLRREPEKTVTGPLPAFLDDCLDFLYGLLPEGVEIRRRITVADDLVTGIDNALLMQMIVNLCTNAADAMDGKGRITVEARLVAGETPETGCRILPVPAGPCAAVSVADTGHGIDEVNVPLVFEPFFTTKPAGKGTGMGLPIVRDILARIRGGLHLETSSRGTRFTLYLPILPDREAAAEKTAALRTAPAAVRESVPEPSAPKPDFDILIVHADLAAMARVAGHCGKWGFRAATAGSGRDAFERLAAMTVKPRLALVQYPTPGMDSEEFVNTLYALDAALPVVLWTGSGGRTPDTDELPNVAECVAGPLSTRDLARLVRLFR